ncbi:MAG: RNA 2',3'-cyclic phosphodiesterase [Rhodospirillaceae bacterium]
MFRLFVGLALPETVRTQLSLLAEGLPSARWVDPDNYHMTLRFIGEVDRHAAADIDSTLQRIDTPPFEFTLSGLGTFGQGRKTRAMFARAQPCPALAHLQSKVESAVVRAGQPPEPRKFSPHVTLARFRAANPVRIQSFVEHHSLFWTDPVPVDRIVMFESHMGKGGSVYDEVAAYPLGDSVRISA